MSLQKLSKFYLKADSVSFSLISRDFIANNMKLAGFLVLVVLAAFVRSDNEMMMKIVGTCLQSTGASEDDVKKLSAHIPPETKTQKCLMSCVLTGLGIVSKL